eukprot:TRINITY_DN13971_c0_g1_i1.p1 TRINITY_DN13971_c0_g1~~TRINITY_DN13971_c0_g1_i1.p1  ORF type:complete len:431 (+),score=54.14 TRINITY_DN13971_c0_g1_i1:280-1572(+)
MSASTVPEKKPFDTTRSEVLPVALSCLEERLHPRQQSTNACPVSHKFINKNNENFLMVKSKTFENVYSLAFKFGTLASGQEVIRPLGYFVSAPRPEYFNNYEKGSNKLLHSNFYSLSEEEKTRLMRAWIEEVVFVFFDADFVREKPRAFEIPGAPSWNQSCSNGDIKIWCWYHHEDQGNKIFVLRHWKFDPRTGEFQGRAKYTEEKYFVVNETEDKMVTVPVPSPVQVLVPSSGHHAVSGNSEDFCSTFKNLSRRYHSGFAHDRGHLTTFKGWFWNGSAVSNPNKISAQAMAAAGWNDAENTKKQKLALAWAREVIHSSDEIIFKEKPRAASIPGILEGVESTTQGAHITLRLWILREENDAVDVSYEVVQFDATGAVANRESSYVGSVDSGAFRVFKYRTFPVELREEGGFVEGSPPTRRFSSIAPYPH